MSSLFMGLYLIIYIRKKQPVYKPGSVILPYGKMPVIYLRPSSPTGSSGLPSDVGRATLVGVGLHDLTTPKMHSPICHHTAGGLLPHLLTLTLPKRGGSFLLHDSTFADSFPLGSGMLCVARTFLFCLAASATSRPAAFPNAKVSIFIGLWKFHFVILYF